MNILYNLADLINKGFFGLAVWAAFFVLLVVCVSVGVCICGICCLAAIRA